MVDSCIRDDRYIAVGDDLYIGARDSGQCRHGLFPGGDRVLAGLFCGGIYFASTLLQTAPYLYLYLP